MKSRSSRWFVSSNIPSKKSAFYTFYRGMRTLLTPGYYFLQIGKGCTAHDEKNKLNISSRPEDDSHSSQSLIIKPNMSEESDVIHMWSGKSTTYTTHAAVAALRNNESEMEVGNWMHMVMCFILMINIIVAGFYTASKLREQIFKTVSQRIHL